MLLVETDEGGPSSGEYHDEELEQWLTANNIQSAKQKLLEKNVKLQELVEIDPNNAKEYAKSSLHLDEIEANRFVKAIKSLSVHDNMDSDTLLSKSQIIVLSNEANNAMNNLYRRMDETSTNIRNIKNQIDILKETSQINEENINKFKQQIIDKITQRLQHLLKKSHKDVISKINILSNYLKTFQNYNEELIQSESTINALLNNNIINKTKREQAIVELSQTVLDTNIIEPQIIPRVQININKNVIIRDIHKIGSIHYSSRKRQRHEIKSNDTTEQTVFSESPIIVISNTMETFSATDNNLNDAQDKKEIESGDAENKQIDWREIYSKQFGIVFKEMQETKEYWTTVGDETERLDDDMTINKLDNGYSSNFGNIFIRSISHGICLWRIKINIKFNKLWNKFNKSWDMNKYFTIGISSDYSSDNKTFYDNKQSSNYGYCDNGNKVSRNVLKTYGKSWSDGDIIGLKLDEIQKCIEFFHNGDSQGIAYRNIDTDNDIAYRLAVHMYYKDSSVTIENFEYLQ